MKIKKVRKMNNKRRTNLELNHLQDKHLHYTKKD